MALAGVLGFAFEAIGLTGVVGGAAVLLDAALDARAFPLPALPEAPPCFICVAISPALEVRRCIIGGPGGPQ